MLQTVSANVSKAPVIKGTFFAQRKLYEDAHVMRCRRGHEIQRCGDGVNICCKQADRQTERPHAGGLQPPTGIHHPHDSPTRMLRILALSTENGMSWFSFCTTAWLQAKFSYLFCFLSQMRFLTFIKGKENLWKSWILVLDVLMSLNFFKTSAPV